MNAEKSIRLKKRGTDQYHQVTPVTWKKMQDSGKGEYYEEIKKPSVPKEVAEAKNKKLSGSKKPESETNDSTRITDRLPGEDVGEIG